MKQRFFFDRIHTSGNEPAVVQRVEDAVSVFTDLANAAFQGFDDALVRTKPAPYLVVFQAIVKIGFHLCYPVNASVPCLAASVIARGLVVNRGVSVTTTPKYMLTGICRISGTSISFSDIFREGWGIHHKV
jgi:hypothetical protein